MLNIFNVNDTAQKLHISTVTLRRFIKKRVIPFHKIGKKYYFTEEDINEYLILNSYAIIKDEKNENT